MKYQLTLLAICGGLLLAACSGAKTAPEANKNSAKPATATPATAAATPAAAKADVAASEGEPIKHAEAGIQFVAPKGWKNEKDGDSVTLTSPDDGVAVVFVVSSSADLDKAVNAAAGELDKIIKKAKIVTEAEESKVNGLNAVSLNGTGELDGKPVAWDLTVIGAKKPMLVISMGTPESLEKHGKEYESLVNSIKPL